MTEYPVRFFSSERARCASILAASPDAAIARVIARYGADSRPYLIKIGDSWNKINRVDHISVDTIVGSLPGSGYEVGLAVARGPKEMLVETPPWSRAPIQHHRNF